jgi:hypothetical protein
MILTPDVEQARADVIAQHYPTVRLRKEFAIQSVYLN